MESTLHISLEETEETWAALGNPSYQLSERSTLPLLIPVPIPALDYGGGAYLTLPSGIAQTRSENDYLPYLVILGRYVDWLFRLQPEALSVWIHDHEDRNQVPCMRCWELLDGQQPTMDDIIHPEAGAAVSSIDYLASLNADDTTTPLGGDFLSEHIASPWVPIQDPFNGQSLANSESGGVWGSNSESEISPEPSYDDIELLIARVTPLYRDEFDLQFEATANLQDGTEKQNSEDVSLHSWYESLSEGEMRPFLELEQVPPPNSLLKPESLPEPDLDLELTQESIPASVLAPVISDSEPGTPLSATSALAPLSNARRSCDYKYPTGKTCGEKFRRVYDLIRHRNSIHTTALTVQCSHCERKFKRADALLRHIQYTCIKRPDAEAQERRNRQARRPRKPRKKKEGLIEKA